MESARLPELRDQVESSLLKEQMSFKDIGAFSMMLDKMADQRTTIETENKL